MDEKNTNLQAEEQLAVLDPEAYAVSNPTPRDWDMSAQDIARSVRINPVELLTTKAQREGPEKYNWLETVGHGVWEGISQGVKDINRSINVRNVEYSSPNMTQAEAERLMQDALYTRHVARKSEQTLDAQKIKYDTTYDFSNALGTMIKYVGLGFVTGSPATVGAVAGVESAANLEADMVDSYVEKYGTIAGYDKERRAMDLGLAGAYGVFTGITESMLGVDRIAAGALGRYSKMEAMSRLARQQGKLGASAAWKAARRLGMSALEEGTEEFVQQLGEDVTKYAGGYEDAVFTDENFKKAIVSAAYGAILGGPMGWGLYRYNRKSVIDKINSMNTDNGWGMTEKQIVEAADQILDDSKTRMVDEIATRAEIQNHYGQAYDLIKQRIADQIEATGTTPWTDQNKSKEEYIQTLADSITIPAINMSNVLHIPLSEFLEIADIEKAMTAGNIAVLQPIRSVEDIDAIIANQDAIIKDQREKKKLGIDNEELLKRARQRKAIAERVRKEIVGDQEIKKARTTRKKETADYVTARDLQPEQTTTIETATQAQPGEDYVLFAGQRIPVEYQVVELASIQPSHIEGTPNPNYTNIELQNRASRGTTQDVADLREKATNITPERLMRASTSAEGAPVVNAKGEVIAGNGRTEIVRYAYQNPESAEKYKQELVKQGFNIEGMEQPILIRRNTTMNEQEQIAAADISNISETSAFDEASQARRDTKYLKDSANPTEFAAKLPMSERRGLMQNNGKWNKRKVQQRYEDALLSWLAGNDTQLFENLVLDRGLSQKVIDILTANGSLVYETATKYPELEIREDLYRALVKMQRATRENFLEITQQLELDGHDVMPENILVYNWLFADATTNRQFLSNYATILANNHESVNAGQDMFGQTVAPISKKDALMQALKKADEAKAELAASRGKEYLPLFTQEGEATDVNLAAAIVSFQNQFAPVNTGNQLSQEVLQQFDLADENARLDDMYPEYTGDTIKVDGKERTVYNSNGDRIAKSKEALTNFWRWFGDSKVVDEQGRPLVVYHGSDAVFNEFKYPDFSNTLASWKGKQPKFFFATNINVAKEYSPDRTNIYSVYLKTTKPKIIDAQGKYWTNVTDGKAKTPDQIAEQTAAQEYDALIIKNIDESISEKADTTDDYIVFDSTQVKSVNNRGTFSPYDSNIYYQKRGVVRGFYDPELQAIVLSKYWNETTLVHEYHHRFLEKLWGYFKEAQTGDRAVPEEFMQSMQQLFNILDIDPTQDQLTVVQQEKFATMVEAYLTGLGVDNQENMAFKGFLHWIPEQYKSIMNLGYLDENNEIQNPILDQASIDFFNRWFANPMTPSLPSAPDAQRMVNVTDDKDEIIPSNQKVMNNREKEWGQDSEQQLKADAQLWRAIGENNPSDLRAALDGEEELMKAEAKTIEDDRILPEKPTLRDKWFKARQPDARATAAEKAREYVAKNPEHARELAFADPETMTEYDAPVDQGMLIRAVMETVPHGSDEWYILDNNLAMVKSMSGSTLALSGDLSHQAYLDAKREVEEARELKAAVNYAGTRRGAMEKWNSDIRAFAARRVAAIMATEPESQERKTAIKAFLEEAKTKFSGNTTNAILNQLDLTGMKTKNSQVFIKWAENQIKQAAHAKIDAKEQAELMKASIKAQLALREIDSTEVKDGKYVRAVQSAKDIRHWQFVKDKMKKAYIGRWGRVGIFMDNLFGGYMPSAMLMSINTLFFANVPSTALNQAIVKQSAKVIGKNAVDPKTMKAEGERIRQIFNGSGMNLAQMEKPTSPSLMHGEKYTNQEQTHWYNFTFEILGREDNWFRIPTFVDALGRIATKNANGDSAKATALFKEYAKLNNQTDEAKIARKQALAVANMAVFTQDGMLASALNHIRSQLNTLSRGMLGLEPGGFGLGNILAPFLKTGANVIEMGVRGTIAPVRQLVQIGKKLQGKEIPELEKLSMRVDWTYFALTAVATALAAAVNSDDEEWYIPPYEMGQKYDPNKPYDSIKMFGTWVKLDIFGPLEVPLRTAAMIIKDWEEKQFAAIGSGIAFGAKEALGETPLASQFTDANLDYMSTKKYWSGFAYNQANKLIPAQLKTATRAASRATDTTLDVSDYVNPTIERKFHRNYGLDGQRLTTNDLIGILTNRVKVKEEDNK